MAKLNSKSLSLTQRRRAIYSGLYPYIQGDELLKAMCIWQQQYSSLPSFAIVNFVTEILEDTLLAPKRASIHLSITSSLMLGEDNLAPDPLEDMYDYLVRTNGKEKANLVLAKAKQEAVNLKVFDSRADTCKVYEMVIDQLLKEVAAQSIQAAKEIEISIVNKFKELEVDEETLKSIRKWLKDNTVLQITLDVNKLRDSLNAAYVTSCSWVGPSRTDKIMNSVIESVENHKISQSFSPRELL
jgi:hypothetical protein